MCSLSGIVMVLRGHKTVVSLSDATRADGGRAPTSSVDKLSSISINKEGRKERNGLFLVRLPNYIKAEKAKTKHLEIHTKKWH